MEDNKETVDIVLLDIHIPKIKGDKLLPKLMNIKADVQVIVLTAFKESEVAISTFKQGSLFYLNKPA